MKRVAIARTDSIGDVILTLPMAGAIKQSYPNVEVVFIGKGYTKNVVECCVEIDEFVDWEQLKSAGNSVNELKALHLDAILFALPNLELAKAAFKAKIPKRIGVSKRWFHWLYCNFRPAFSRRKSDLHEAQLNLKLLEPLIAESTFSLKAVQKLFSFEPQVSLPDRFEHLLNISGESIVIHPKSQGSAREWGLDNFRNFAEIAIANGHTVFITGTEKEGKLIRPHFKFSKQLIDLTGQMNLSELIAFISKANGLIAASTGPLHIAAALGRIAIGLYSTLRPIHPGRWAPIGPKAQALTYDGPINNNLTIANDHTIELIDAERVFKTYKEISSNV